MYAQLPVTNFPDAAEAFTRGQLIRRLPTPGIQHKTAPLMEEFARVAPQFLELPEEVQRAWCIHRPEDDEPDDGFIVRRGLNGGPNKLRDYKVFLHFRSDSRVLFTQHGLDWKPYQRLFELAEVVRRECVQVVADLALSFDRLYPSGKVPERMARGERSSVLRVLYYYQPHDIGKLGEPHLDRCCFTLHCGHSEPGLSVEEVCGSVACYHTEDDSCLAFMGKKAPEIIPGVRAGRHWAYDGRRSPEDGRCAVVYFSHYHV